MGFVNRTETRFPSQGRIASHGGFLPRAGPFFAAACLQIPAPPFPEHPPSTLEHFGMLLLAVALLFVLVLLALPAKWSRRIAEIAFCIGKDRQ
jgi:hypothetical protein